MSNDRIIDFNELKNKVKSSDVDKFEDYIYNLYFKVMDGKITMAEFSNKLVEYMRDNDISESKFMNIQKKFMERYGMDVNDVEKQLKDLGFNYPYSVKDTSNSVKDTSKSDLPLDETDFYKKFGEKIVAKNCILTQIKNDINDIDVIIENEKVMLFSYKKINIVDSDLNELLLAYKKMFEKKIKIIICESTNSYDY